MILGIDSGSSTTDVVVMSKKKRNVVDLCDDVDAALKKYDVSSIIATGCGANTFGKSIGGIPVQTVDEITAIGAGGQFVSGKKNCLVVSVGSGTCMVSVKGTLKKHIGGTAVGGRTLTGLGELLLGTSDYKKIENLALKGDLARVDLTLESIYPKGVGLLPKNATASHFGGLKLSDGEEKKKKKKYRKCDLALGLLNMIAQTIGTLSVFAAKAEGHSSVVLTGKVTQSAIVREIIKKRITTLHNIPVEIPRHAPYATAIGAIVGGTK